MFSPIKFQADMGVLLAFMFIWNMVGALVLLPALAHFLLPVSRVVTCAQATTSAVKTASADPIEVHHKAVQSTVTGSAV